MSSLDELQISGIRSFGPKSGTKIKFFTPLTLIVGTNGSGKTTIIECLKYITTGEQPPNTKTNAAFIHDPQLVGEREVKALVKLQFYATTGARMVASRRQQATMQKTGKVKASTLECNLYVAHNGEKKSLSSRAVELEAIVPQYLGVPKAILENVIFCHQDDSLWPLSEPSVLKKKFDAIFEAEKYTKAIENIRVLRKKQNEELGKFKIIEEHAKQDKDRGLKLKRKCLELEKDVDKLREEVEDLGRKQKDAAGKSQTALENAGKFEATIGQIQTLRNQQQYLNQRIEQLGEDLEERTESDDWLMSELESHEERLDSYRSRQDDCQNRSKQVQQEIDNLRTRQATKRTEAGTYKEQRRSQEKKVQERQELIQETAKEHSIRGFDAELDEMQIVDFMDRIARLSKDQTSKVEKLRKENATEAKKVQDILDGLREKRTEAQQAKNYARSMVTENDRKVSTLQSELRNITSDEGGKAVIEANIEDFQNRLTKLREESAAADRDERAQKVAAKIRECEERAEALNRELIDSTAQSTSLAKLDHLRQETKDRQTSLNTLFKTYGNDLKLFLGHDADIATLEEDVLQVVGSKTRAHATAQKERDDVNSQLQKAGYELNTAKSKQKLNRQDLTKHEEIIKDAVECDDPENYLEELAQMQKDRDIIAGDVNSFSTTKIWYEKCIDTANKKKCCALCTRGFDDGNQLQRFLERMERRATAEELKKLQADLAEIEKLLKDAQSVRGNYDTWHRIKKTGLPATDAEVQQCEKKYKELSDKLENLDITVGDCEEEKRKAESISKTASNISKVKSELDKVQQQADELVASQDESQKLRPLADIKDDLDAANCEAREARTEHTKIQVDEKRSRQQLSSLELDLSSAKSRLITANADLERKATKLTQIEDLKQSSQQQRTAMQKHDEELQAIEPHLQEENNRLAETRRQGQMRENELQRQANDIMNNLNMLTNAEREIRFYIDQGGPTKLAQVEQEIEGLESRGGTLDAELRQITSEMNCIQAEFTNADRLKRSINDNLRYREAARELRQNRSELEQLEQLDAEADQERYRREYDRHRRYHEAWASERVSKLGTLRAKDEEMGNTIREWEGDYADAGRKYKKAHIEVETSKAAIEDLGRYGTALDKAILKFHSLKMAQINEIIDELWKKTYQGSDVDAIIIRGDTVITKGGTAGGGGSKSYNYRVCMVKQGTEMDMRGRCSAGQRVLACIIIRLALAQCFGVNCGMIALDEPTTNLDRENIRSLAEALHDIIEHRRRQKNFQLIVITHDEDFLGHMRCGDFAEHFYKVSRDRDQRSQVHRNEVAMVGVEQY